MAAGVDSNSVASPSRTLRCRGRVCSGMGVGDQFTRLDWVADFFRERFGFDPHPGTFNLAMAGESWERDRARLLQRPGVAIPPPPGSCRSQCFRVRIGGRASGVVVFPEVAGYPVEKFEVIAPLNLRVLLAAADGDLLDVEIAIDD